MNIRQTMIAEAMTKTSLWTCSELANYLPADFGILPEDLAEMPPPPIDAEFVVVESPDVANVVREVEAPRTHVEAQQQQRRVIVPPTPDKIEVATTRMLDCQNTLANAKNYVVICQRRELDTRKTLSEKILQFQSGFAKVTPEQLKRDYIASELATRAALGGDAPPPAVIARKSRIDQQRAYARGGEHSGNSGRAVDMMGGGKVYPQSMKGMRVPQ